MHRYGTGRHVRPGVAGKPPTEAARRGSAPRRRSETVAALGAVVLALALALAGCGGDAGGGTGGKVALRLGYFPNLTHATAIVGVKDGYFARALGDSATLETKTFNAGPDATQALLSGAVDATYIGPGPSTNAYAKSQGAVRIVSGATSGGAALVVKPGITKAGLKGKRIATPQLGNTQDIALRYWLEQQGLQVTTEGGGDVAVLPQDNSQAVQAFSSGQIDGAWVPEPYASRLKQEGGKVLVDERTLWPGGKFVTTNLLVRADFLKAHPDVVTKLLEGQVDANSAIAADPAKVQATVAAAIGDLTGKPLDAKLVAAAWKSLTFTDDPVAPSLIAGAEHATAVGLLDKVDNLAGIYDLSLLNQVLRAKGQKEVRQP